MKNKSIFGGHPFWQLFESKCISPKLFRNVSANIFSFSRNPLPFEVELEIQKNTDKQYWQKQTEDFINNG